MKKKLTSRIVTPLSYKKIHWKDAQRNQEVYLLRVREGEKWAYGPYTVKDSFSRTLITPSGKDYKDNGVDLLVKL